MKPIIKINGQPATDTELKLLIFILASNPLWLHARYPMRKGEIFNLAIEDLPVKIEIPVAENICIADGQDILKVVQQAA